MTFADELQALAEREARLDSQGGWKGEKSPLIAGAFLQRPIVKDYGIQYPGQKLPVSRALPLNTEPGQVVIRNGQRVREHKDGSYSDMQGRRIIASRADVERAEAATGIRRD